MSAVAGVAHVCVDRFDQGKSRRITDSEGLSRRSAAGAAGRGGVCAACYLLAVLITARTFTTGCTPESCAIYRGAAMPESGATVEGDNAGGARARRLWRRQPAVLFLPALTPR